MHVKVLPMLLVHMSVRWYGECILLKQIEPTNGTPARPGDRIKFLCNTTFSNETTLVWGVIDGESTRGFFGNHMNASNGTLKLPNGDTATWEAKALHGATQTLTSSLTINASCDLHNVTIACCSEHSPSLCSESPAIPTDYKGFAVINISVSNCENKTTALFKDQHNLAWAITSSVSLIGCTLTLMGTMTFYRCPLFEKKVNFWELILLIDATTFAFINLFPRLFIHFFNQAETTYCIVLGVIFQVILTSTIFITALLSLYLFAKFRNFPLQLKCFSWRREYMVFIGSVSIVITGVLIAPFVYGSYGNTGGWCWIKKNDNVAGFSCQIITSSLGLIMALLGFVFAMAECWRHKETVMRCWRHTEHTTHYEDFLDIAVCFLTSFLISNFISLVTALATETPLYYLHSVIYPLWPFGAVFPMIVRLLIDVRKRAKKPPKTA